MKNKRARSTIGTDSIAARENNPKLAFMPSFLRRAIVALPESMCNRERPLQERLVIFECVNSDETHQVLQEILAQLWRVNTNDWCERGFIYNMTNCAEHLREYVFGPEEDGNLRIFESGSGGEFGVGADRTHYWRARDVDLFCTPRYAGHLSALLKEIEQMYDAEPERRATMAKIVGRKS